MKKEFIQSNILIRGNFVPSKFDKLFFIKSELIEENEFLETSSFTPNMTRILTSRFVLTIRSSQILIANRKDFNDDFIKDIVFKIISDENSECSAAGVNFKWFVFNEDDIEEHTRKAFYPTNSKVINRHFDKSNSAFGYYASTDFKGSRMRMDIKPSLIKNIKEDSEQKILQFEFNFHLNFQQEKSNKDLFEKLNNYNSYLAEAEKIIEEYE
ncbi:hypothetical protein ACW6QP_01200 [Salegentibacter sp. HM20]